MVFPAIDGATALTSSSRLARWLFYQNREEQKRAGLKCWATPQVFCLTDWLGTIWRKSWPEQYVLSNLQSIKLWETIIQGDPRTPKTNLLHLQGAAIRAAQAYRLIRQYRLLVTENSSKQTHESETFRSWIKQYEFQLTQWKALDSASLLDKVEECMKTGSIPLPNRRLILAGFNEITPQLKSWLEFLQSKDVAVQHWPETPPQQPANKIAKGCAVEVREYKNRRQEAIQCARWIRINTGKTVGVVDLSQYGTLLKNELTAELAPQSIFPWMKEELPFNFPVGNSLAREPMIQLILSIFSAPGKSIAFTTLSSILATPFLRGGRDEANVRRNLDSLLRRKNTNAVYLNWLCSSKLMEHLPQLKSILQSWKEMIANDQRQPPSAWAHYFSGFLRRTGWPAREGSLTQRTRQAHRVWTECLDAFASLDRSTGDMNRLSAANLLSQITREKSFHLKTHDQPVQVVGLEESSGMKFDCLWVMGCNADIFPAAPSPNPFLPAPPQKNLPHYSSEWELKFAEQSLARLLRSSPNIVFSFSQWDQKTQLRMSPLLKYFPNINPAPEITNSCRILDQLRPQAELQTWQDELALPLTGGERHKLDENVSRQGFGVLKNQAHCPFRAFARHRLHVVEMTIPEIHDDESMERGNIVHNALEFFWAKIKDRAGLQRLKEENHLTPVIQNCINQAINKTFSRMVLNTQPQFIKLEFDRVMSLLQNWLELELLRPDFEVILKEKDESITIGELRLNIRIDRMDKVAGNQRILIDYKTGKCSTNDWFQERIQEPQLPLYALKFSPDAIAYAAVQKDKKKFGWKTVACDDSVIQAFGCGKSSKRVDWQEQMNTWQKNLTTLAQEFLDGELSISPFKGNKTCEHCGLNALCRVEETESFTLDPEETNE